MFVPFRKFVAAERWMTVGPLVHRALDDPVSHDDLDERIIAVERAELPLVFGWLRYAGTGVDVIADAAPGTSSDFAVWLDPLLRRWADAEGVSLGARLAYESWSPGA